MEVVKVPGHAGSLGFEIPESSHISCGGPRKRNWPSKSWKRSESGRSRS